MDFFTPKYWWAPNREEIARFREFLGHEIAGQLTDQQIHQLWREMWDWTNLLLGIYEAGGLGDIDQEGSSS